MSLACRITRLTICGAVGTSTRAVACTHLSEPQPSSDASTFKSNKNHSSVHVLKCTSWSRRRRRRCRPAADMKPHHQRDSRENSKRSLARKPQSTPRLRLPSSFSSLVVSWMVTSSSTLLFWLSSHSVDSLSVQYLPVSTRSPFMPSTSSPRSPCWWTCETGWDKWKHNNSRDTRLRQVAVCLAYNCHKARLRRAAPTTARRRSGRAMGRRPPAWSASPRCKAPAACRSRRTGRAASGVSLTGTVRQERQQRGMVTVEDPLHRAHDHLPRRLFFKLGCCLLAKLLVCFSAKSGVVAAKLFFQVRSVVFSRVGFFHQVKFLFSRVRWTPLRWTPFRWTLLHRTAVRWTALRRPPKNSLFFFLPPNCSFSPSLRVRWWNLGGVFESWSLNKAHLALWVFL